MEACVTIDGDRFVGFFSRVAMGHIYVVGFIRQMLDVLKGKSRFAWLLDFDTTVNHDGFEMSWSLDLTDKHL